MTMVELQGPLSFSDTLDMLIRAAAEIEKRVEEEKNSEGTSEGFSANENLSSPDSYRPASASGRPMSGSGRPKKSQRRMQNRSSHNELEKNRRAHLRGCLDSLKAIVPLNRDTPRHTTLGLLNQACELIKNLERRHAQYKSELELQTKRRDALMKRFKSVDANFRIRRESTGSSWSSSRSESSNDSDKDEEMVIDVTTDDGSVVSTAASSHVRYENTVMALTPSITNVGNVAGSHRYPNKHLITINVRKPISIPAQNRLNSSILMKKMVVS